MPVPLLSKSCSSFCIHFLHVPSPTPLPSESLFLLLCEPCTLKLIYTSFHSLIVSCTYSLSFNYILTFMSWEHVFFLWVFRRNSRVSTEVRLSEHLTDALLSWVHMEMGINKDFRFEKRKTIWGLWVVMITQDSGASYYCWLPPNMCVCVCVYIAPTANCIHIFNPSFLKLESIIPVEPLC